MPAGLFAANSLAYEMLYGCEESLFARFSRTQGAALVADGLGMLVEQAAEAFLLWRGVRPDTAPVLAELRALGWNLIGPVPADTAFVPHRLAQVDAVLAMFHDQGLPVLKHLGFGRAVNVTLGLPIIRTSVDHGTALDLAGTDRADLGSLAAALTMALGMVRGLAS